MSISAVKKLGFGTMRLLLIDPDKAKRIDHNQVCQLVNIYLDRGFCCFDTAYIYHEDPSDSY